MNILVFLGSKSGNEDIYKEACIELADWISKNNYGLVYGANAKGLMGVLADRAIKNGVNVTGVMPKFLIGQEEIHTGINQYFETETMQERKDLIRSLSDVCIAMPGGPGTMEEITEAYSLYLVNQSKSPCIVFNKNGYYDHLKKHYDQMVDKGFLTKTDREKLLFSESFEEIDNFIKKMIG